MNDFNEMEALVKELNEACKAYYVDSNPIMSDYEFDLKYDRLLDLESVLGVIPGSPTQNVGWHEVIKELPEVKLSYPMMSLDKCHTIDEIIKFAKDYYCYLGTKCDGLSMILSYENGNLISAATRGNGIIGSDVTHNAKVIENIPKHTLYNNELVLGGEVVVDYNTFNKINETLPENKKYKHPRNLASASLTLQDNAIAKERGMKFIVWRVIKGFDDDDSIKNSNFLKLKTAEKFGFEIADMLPYNNKLDKDHLNEMLEAIKEKSIDKGVPCDGVVIAIDDIPTCEKLGRTSKFPLHSISYKFSDELVETVLENIIWQTSKTGLMNPVAVFKSVDLGGAITTNATLHNPEYIEGLRLGIGDRILVKRANMVIPRVEDNIDRSGTYEFPTTCSCCGGPAEMRKSGKTKMLYCTNPNCSAKLVGLLTHAVSRDALNIDGLSEATIEFLCDKGWVSSIKDLYHLDQFRKYWITYSGYGEKSVDKILVAIEKSRKTGLIRFIYSLSIPQVGHSASKEISKICHGSIDEFFEKLTNGKLYTLLYNTPGYGDAIVNEMKNYIKINFDLIKDLAQEFTFNIEGTAPTDNSLANKVFCITGSVFQFKNRKEFQKYVEDRGGKVAGSVTSKIDYLVCNEDSSSSKCVTAKKFGKPIISEVEFLERFK